MDLSIFLHDKYVGTVFHSINDLLFKYDKAYIADNNPPISHYLPLQEASYDSFACLAFFNALLPEGKLLTKISTNTLISEYSTLKLLRLMGQECAGALSFFDIHEYNTENSIKLLRSSCILNENNYTPLSQKEVNDIVINSYKTPFLISSKQTCTTLCGEENKILLTFFDNKWHTSFRSSPTTHILKPSRSDFPSFAINEYICNLLARELGINVPDFSLMICEDKSVFVSKRFDRFIDKESNSIKKLHQESFSQALGIKSYTKYQKDGGPSLALSAELLRNCSSSVNEDLEKFCYVTLFNYLIGNANAHGKNFALLYNGYSKPRLAPFYDLSSTTIYPTVTTKMAMSIGGEYEISKITKECFKEEARSMNVSPSLFFNKAIYIKENVSKAFKNIEKHKELQNYSLIINSIKEQFISRLNSLLS